MRLRILRTLLHKELLRLGANRGAVAPAGLLVAAAGLLALFSDRAGAPAAALTGGAPPIFVDYWDERDPWVEHLRGSVPEALKERVTFRSLAGRPGQIFYPPGVGAIQLRPPGGHDKGPGYLVWVWYPGDDGTALAAYEEWFWRESRHYFRERVAAAATRLGSDPPAASNEDRPAWSWQESHEHFRAQSAAALEKLSPQGRSAVESEVPPVTADRSPLKQAMAFDLRSVVALALVSFSLFFVCVYLLPQLTCEERERGTLLAQALSPASAWEVLTAKMLLHFVLAVGLAGVLAAIGRPVAVSRPFFWMIVAVAAVGFQGVGLTVAALARTPRSASTAALCYTMAIGLALIASQHDLFWWLRYFVQEYHALRMLYATMTGPAGWRPSIWHYGNLVAAAVLACAWTALAARLFRRRAWQ
jgi:hypothetical protein